MTAPVPVPDGTNPPAEAVEAAVRRALEDAMGCNSGPFINEQYGHACGSQAHTDALNNGCCDFASDLAAAVVAALRLPERDRETAAKAWDRGYTAGHSNAMRRMSDEPNAPTSRNPYAEHDPAALGRASALREGRADG